MNTVLYLVAHADKHTPYFDLFESMEIMNENNLREFFMAEMKTGNIAAENLENHNITPEDDIYNVDISEIFGALCDNDEYDEHNQYYVSQQDVEIDDCDMYD